MVLVYAAEKMVKMFVFGALGIEFAGLWAASETPLPRFCYALPDSAARLFFAEDRLSMKRPHRCPSQVRMCSPLIMKLSVSRCPVYL